MTTYIITLYLNGVSIILYSAVVISVRSHVSSFLIHLREELMKQICCQIFLALFLLTAATAHATTHIIKFGGSLGKKYAPKSITVAVGDTIIWTGNFDDHPLSLIKSPPGATGFMHIEKGTKFIYIVKVAGNYEYQCDEHIDEGMVGSFVAIGDGAKEK